MYLQRKYVNRFDNRGCKEMDDLATRLFLKKANELGWIPTKASRIQDTREHWDWKLTKKNVSMKVDIKSLKRIDSTKDPDDRLICLEYTNVVGNVGWLRGQSDYIAFLITEGFAFVPTKELLKYSSTVIDWDGPVYQSVKDKKEHIIYQRSQWGREDKVAYLTKKEILSLTKAIWRTDDLPR